MNIKSIDIYYLFNDTIDFLYVNKLVIDNDISFYLSMIILIITISLYAYHNLIHNQYAKTIIILFLLLIYIIFLYFINYTYFNSIYNYDTFVKSIGNSLMLYL